jgi:alanyl-tRNA synthetase
MVIQTASGKEIFVEIKTFSGLDVKRMVETANALIKRNDATIAVFGGRTENTSNLVIMSGSIPVTEGFNARAIIPSLSAIIGGNGGGRINFAQGGGTKPDKLPEALEEAKKAIKRQFGQ